MSNTPIQEIIEALQADRKTPSPRYPVQALAAIRDPQVAKILEDHLTAGARLVSIRALPYEATLGLIPVVFELQPAGPVALRHPSILILVDGRGRVASVIDGFDPAQPNPYYVPSPSSAQPFVFLDPSAMNSMQFSAADIAPTLSRTHEYMRRSAPAYAARRGEDNEGELIDSYCSELYTYSTALMAIATFSGGLFFKTVDDHRTFTQPDVGAKTVVDDEIVIVEPIEL